MQLGVVSNVHLLSWVRESTKLECDINYFVMRENKLREGDGTEIDLNCFRERIKELARTTAMTTREAFEFEKGRLERERDLRWLGIGHS
ncbi:hypothetical protein [Paenibacillus sp. GCM10027626]|uniref:hypothetical protein n=1 Tax=Paenibacillus sp. GCM10027626 TaxID=3273411 RepID=UPI003641F50F